MRYLHYHRFVKHIWTVFRQNAAPSLFTTDSHNKFILYTRTHRGSTYKITFSIYLLRFDQIDLIRFSAAPYKVRVQHFDCITFYLNTSLTHISITKPNKFPSRKCGIFIEIVICTCTKSEVQREICLILMKSMKINVLVCCRMSTYLSVLL